MFPLLLMLCMVIQSSCEAPPQCLGVLKSVNYADIYNGLDVKVTGNNPRSASSMMLGGDASNNEVQKGDSVDLVFNFNDPIKVSSISFSSKAGRKANVLLLNHTDDVVSDIEIRQKRGVFKITYNKFYDVKTVRINMRVPIKVIQAVDVAHIELMICTDPVDTCTEQWATSKYGTAFTMTSSDISDPEIMLKGSESLVIQGCDSSVYNLKGSGKSIVKVTFSSVVDVTSVSMETHNVKSVSMKMFHEGGKRSYRDTAVVSAPKLLSSVTQVPIIKRSGIKEIEIELRTDFTKIGVQNLVIGVCVPM